MALLGRDYGSPTRLLVNQRTLSKVLPCLHNSNLEDFDLLMHGEVSYLYEFDKGVGLRFKAQAV